MNEQDQDHLLELAHGYIERSLSPAQLAELETLLSENAEARRIYVDFLHDHASLHWEQIGEEGQLDEIPELSDYRSSRLPSLWQAFAAAAVISLLGLVLLNPGGASPAFATMVRTESARWESGTLPTAEGARLGAGELNLVRGLATISFDSGAEVILEAPARLALVDAMNCILTSGTAVAEVAESAQGFTIKTPSARVIDHGTRFAVNVHPSSGATQTQVFEGLVEVELESRSERIELRSGQRNLVEGKEIGQVSEGLEEGTWSLSEATPSRNDLSVRTITTGDPGGADAYVWAGKPNDHLSDTLLLLKNGLGPGAPHRKAYLRFDLGGITPGKIGSAELKLRFAATGWGLASHLGDSTFMVYGIVDDSLDNWNPDHLDWANAPANGIDSGTAVDSTKVIQLGFFLVPRGIQAGTYGIDGEKLSAFLNSDRNRRASLIVVRESPEIRSGGLVHSFASSRHSTLPPPSLEITLVK